MDEETAIIDQSTRNEKIKNFFIRNKSKILGILVFIVILLILFFSYNEYKDRKIVEISNQYNSLIIEYDKKNKVKTYEGLLNIINKKDSTYSPLALYFIIDNQLSEDKEQLNKLVDTIIKKVSLEKEIKNLIIYKKGLFNAETASEVELLNILKPIINSESVWRSHALYLLAEYFYSKNQKQKSKEFFEQLINLENANQDLLVEAKKRLNRDLSE